VPAYAYQAVDPAGKRLRGRQEAASPAALSRSLEDQGLLVLRVEAVELAPAVSGFEFGFGRRRSVLEVTRALAAALAQHPRLFPPIYVGMMRAGEKSGDLAGAFAGLAAQLEREEQLRERLLSASIYPVLLAAVGGLAVLVLLLLAHPSSG
jgi:type II secretory pathway component PulF